MRLNKNSGFTLLEIIIVIIIVGVLASLALPRFFSTIEYSKSTEALQAMAVMSRSVQRCLVYGGAAAQDINDCDTNGNGTLEFSEIDADDPSGDPNTKFTYAAITIDAADQFTIVATSKAAAADTITLNWNAGVTTMSGTGNFGGIH